VFYEFDDFRLDAGKRLLLRGGQAVAILPKAFDILLYLIRHRERVVTKDEVMKAVWADTFVEEANLTQNVSVIRKTLGERAGEHRFIITAPGRGYRFAATVRESAPAPDNHQAQQLYVRGRHFLNKRLTSALGDAITSFLEATDQDPAFAPAWVGLADAYALLSLYGASMPRDVFPKSKAAAEAALRLDPALAEAHNSLGVVELFYEWNWEAAERSFRRAVELNPSYGDAHQRYGLFLTVMGRFDEARAAMARAEAADPLSRITATLAAYPAYYSREFEDAVRQFRRVIQVDPNFSMAHFRLGLAYSELGRFDEALAELEAAMRLSNDRDVTAALGRVRAMMGVRAGAEQAIAELDARSKDTFVSPYALAAIYAALGEKSRALDLLEQAYEEKSYWIIYLNVDPALDPLRDDPRFMALVRRVF
jgi:DNA-binding winged helix-turn-helix (wHTH) protein/Tfp pilus assembly protein PilF